MEPAQKQQSDVIIPPQFGAPEGQDARLLAERARLLAKDRRVLVHIAVDDVRLWALSDLLAFFAPDVQVTIFPAWDCLPYDRVSPHSDIVARRIDALTTLLDWNTDGLYKPRIALTTINAATQRAIPRDVLRTASLSVRKGGKIDEARLRGFLVDNGYLRTETVREAGEFAIRGSIVDLFPPGYDEPIRIDLFGDEVETIRSFDPSTQRSTGFLDTFSLRPVTEFFLTEDHVQKFRAGYRDMFGVVTQGNPLYEAVSEGRRHAGMEHWQPLFFGEMDTLFSYLDRPALSLDHQTEQARDEREAQVLDFYQARKTLDDSLLARKKKKDGGDVSLTGTAYHPLPPEKLYLPREEFYSHLEGTNPLVLHPFGGPAGEEETAKKARDFGDVRSQPNLNLFHEVAAYLGNLHRKALIACYSAGSAERLKLMFEEHGEKGSFVVCKNFSEASKLKSGQVALAVLSLEHGFVAPDLVVLTEQDILGDRLTRKSASRRKADNFLREVSSLSPGDLVVHIDHGVGRFIALETLKAAGTLHDCLKIEYAGGDKLFVPVENMEVLSRFGSEEGNVQLDKLGGAGWQARKARVKKDLMVDGRRLLKIAAARHLRAAEKLDISSG
jgi:transcription-repair coupling factor (superfamily II helicase)